MAASMTILILSKNEQNEYETTRLLESFSSKNITAMVAHPDNFDIAISHNLNNSIKYQAQDLERPNLVLCRLGAGILPFQLAEFKRIDKKHKILLLKNYFEINKSFNYHKLKLAFNEAISLIFSHKNKIEITKNKIKVAWLVICLK